MKEKYENEGMAITRFVIKCVLGAAVLLAASIYGFGYAESSYGRYQLRLNQENQRGIDRLNTENARTIARLNADNDVHLNEIKIQQTHQLIQVEEQKAKIRVVEAQGISDAQKIINATLTDKYLQHESIKAQEGMANSPNHTTIYIPSGENGIPLVHTTN